MIGVYRLISVVSIVTDWFDSLVTADEVSPSGALLSSTGATVSEVSVGVVLVTVGVVFLVRRGFFLVTVFARTAVGTETEKFPPPV